MQTLVNTSYLISIVSGDAEQHWQTPGESWRELGETTLKLAREFPECNAVEIDRVITKTVAGAEQAPVTESIFSWTKESPMPLETAIGVAFLST